MPVDVDSVNIGAYDSSVGTYHHGNLRAALIETAVELGRVKGPDGIVLREVARRTGVSHNAAYRHFTDRDDLLREVARVGLGELSGAMQSRVRRVRSTDPAERSRLRLREVGKAYVEYALAEPGLFAVGFNRVTLGQLSGPYTLLSSALDECVESGFMPKSKRRGAELVCWAGVHGFAMLYAGTGPLREAPRKQRESDLRRLLDSIEDSLRNTHPGQYEPQSRSAGEKPR
jgi:AcrR family transcriptional regulator